MSGHASGFFLTHRRLLALTFLGAFTLICAAFVFYGLTIPPEYLSTATLKAEPSPSTKAAFDGLAQDIDSDLVGRAVVEGLGEQGRAEFMVPFEKKSAKRPPDIYRLLFNRHWTNSDEANGVFRVHFEHPNPAIAAKVANLYAAQCLAIQQQRKASGAPALALQVSEAAKPSLEPYEPKLPLLISDGVVLGLNLGAGITFIVGAILRARWKPAAPAGK